MNGSALRDASNSGEGFNKEDCITANLNFGDNVIWESPSLCTGACCDDNRTLCILIVLRLNILRTYNITKDLFHTQISYLYYASKCKYSMKKNNNNHALIPNGNRKS